jgi:hypothetical protein
MIATLITALMLYGIIVTVLAIQQALWWEKYSTRDGGIN